MPDESKLLEKRKDARGDKAKLRELKGELIAEANALKPKIAKAVKRARNLKSDEARQKASDRADHLVGQRLLILAEVEEVKADLGEVNARLRRISKKLKKAAQKRLARERYWASEHFRYEEFDTHDGTPVPKSAYPALREWCERIGEPARKQFGSISITSGHRHRAYNAAIGGEPNSVHIYDYPGRNGRAVAVDWHASRGGPRDWYDFAAGKADGRGYYPNSGFTHSDTRNNIGWPDATWQG